MPLLPKIQSMATKGAAIRPILKQRPPFCATVAMAALSHPANVTMQTQDVSRGWDGDFMVHCMQHMGAQQDECTQHSGWHVEQVNPAPAAPVMPVIKASLHAECCMERCFRGRWVCSSTQIRKEYWIPAPHGTVDHMERDRVRKLAMLASQKIGMLPDKPTRHHVAANEPIRFPCGPVGAHTDGCAPVSSNATEATLQRK